MCLKRVCPTWTIAQLRISAEIRPFEFGHMLNVKWRIRISKYLTDKNLAPPIFGPRNLGAIYLNIDQYENHYFAQSSRLHMYEQTGAKMMEIGPANVEINRPPISKLSVHTRCTVLENRSKPIQFLKLTQTPSQKIMILFSDSSQNFLTQRRESSSSGGSLRYIRTTSTDNLWMWFVSMDDFPSPYHGEPHPQIVCECGVCQEPILMIEH